MGDLEALIAGTQEQLGALITRPKLSRKLLGKPPFRFLHDIVFALGREHGFPNLDIFDESELVGKAIKDRDAKVAFLNKVVREVENATGEDVALRPNKVVAGLEPEQTNIFLQVRTHSSDVAACQCCGRVLCRAGAWTWRCWCNALVC